VGNTSKYGLPYPQLSDLPSGPVAVQNLAQALDALGVIGGKRRAAVGSGLTTIEATTVDTQTLAMTANTVFQIDYYLAFTASVAGTDVDMKIRQTSISGTIIGEIVALGVYASPTINYGFLRAIYKTTTAELDYFMGTMVRTGTGTGTVTPVLPTSIIVTNLGPSTIVGDY
jgi:hypothetical protein